MVAPVTGPYSVTTVIKGPKTSLGYSPDWVNTIRRWYRQKRPYNLPLSFKYDDRRVLSQSGQEPSSYFSVNDCIYWVDPSTSDGAYNKARERIVNSIGAAASLSVTLAERKQAMSMIEKRSMQLFRFARALRKGRFVEASKELGLKKPPGHLKLKKGSKNFGNNYLEFHFGWSPLVADIGNAVDVLQTLWPPLTVRATGKNKRVWRTATSYGYDDYSCTVSWRLQTQVRVDNPNYNMANQLGFTNPALVAWELVPYSFVLDWFVNVGDFLSSFTDLSGFTLVNPQRTVFSVTDKTLRPLINYNNHPYRSKVGVTRSVYVERIPGAFPNAVLRVRDPWVLSPRRGLAAISLLLQKLR